MKKAFKTTSLLLAFVMIFATFAGCGNKTTTSDLSDEWETIVEEVVVPNGESSQGGDASAQQGASTQQGGNTATTSNITNLSWNEVKALIPADAKGKTLELISWNPMDNIKQAKGVIERFTKETGINIKWTTVNDCDNIAVAARVAAGDSPDIIRCRNGITNTNLKVLQPLSNVSYNFKDSAWDKNIEALYTANGKVYATTVKGSLSTHYSGVAYNIDLIENYGLEDPYALWKKGQWTWDKMHDIARDFLKQAGTGYNGISVSNIEYAFSMGLRTTYFNGKAYATDMGNQKYVSACKYMADAYQNGLYDTQPGDFDGLNQGKLLFVTAQTLALRTGDFHARELREKGLVGFVPMPSVSGQSDYYSSYGEAEAYGICKGSKNAELVPFFLRYYLDPANYDESTYFGSKKVTEVREWYEEQIAAGKVKMLATTDSTVMTNDTFGMTHGVYSTQILSTDPAQMQSRIDSFLPKMEATINDNNAELKTLVK